MSDRLSSARGARFQAWRQAILRKLFSTGRRCLRPNTRRRGSVRQTEVLEVRALLTGGTHGFTVSDIGPWGMLLLAEDPSQVAGPLPDTFSVVLNAAPLSDVVFTISSSDTTEAVVYPSTLTFTPANWNTPQFVTAMGVDDVIIDGNQLSTISISINPFLSDDDYDTVVNQFVTAMTWDNDSAGIVVTQDTPFEVVEGGVSKSFSVTLKSQPAADVTVVFQHWWIDQADQVMISSDPITFSPSDWNIPHVISVQGIDDDFAEDPLEFKFRPIVNYSDDPNYTFLQIPQGIYVSGTILDDDVRGVVVTPVTQPISENGDSATFSLVLTSQPFWDVSIPISSDNPNEGSVSASVVTFTPLNWNVPQYVTVTGVDDALFDGPVTFNVVTREIETGLNEDPSYRGIDPDDVVLVNLDNDKRLLSFTISEFSISEAGGTAIGQVSRNDADRSNELIVTLRSEDPTEASVPETIVIPPGEDMASFTITAVNDGFIDDPQTVTITAFAEGYPEVSASLVVTDFGNVPPVITSLANSTQSSPRTMPGAIVTVVANFTDMNVGDSHIAIIDWGEYAPVENTLDVTLVESNGSGTVTGRHTYQNPGIFVVTVTIGDNGPLEYMYAHAATAVAVTGMRIVDGTLLIVGTNQNDTVSISTSGKKKLRAQGSFLPRGGFIDFDLASATRIEAWMSGGDDSFDMLRSIDLPAAVIGGRGRDTITGGNSLAVLLDSSVAEGRVDPTALPLSIPFLESSTIDSIFADLIDRDRDHWYWAY